MGKILLEKIMEKLRYSVLSWEETCKEIDLMRHILSRCDTKLNFRSYLRKNANKIERHEELSEVSEKNKRRWIFLFANLKCSV
jgi:hypothetical protein